MTADLMSASRPRACSLLTLCLVGSVATHILVFMLLPGWIAQHEQRARPLTVELLPQVTPQIAPLEPPQPLPMQTREPVKPVVKQTTEQQVPPPPVLTVPPAPSNVPPSPAAAVVPEQRPVPPVPVSEAPRIPAQAAVAVPATPPRSDAAYLNNPRPAYPLAARRRGDQGTVLIRVVVTAEGWATNANIEKSSGHPLLDDAALTAVKSWRFVPARQGGQAIESPYVVPVVFKLD